MLPIYIYYNNTEVEKKLKEDQTICELLVNNKISIRGSESEAKTVLFACKLRVKIVHKLAFTYFKWVRDEKITPLKTLF